MIEYYVDGRLVGKPYKSCYTHEQIIRSCLRALVSQARGKDDVRFLFLGTYSDEESNEESIEDKNMKLRKIVKSFKLEKNVCYHNLKDMIFPINSLSPEKKDWEVMKQVRSAIVKCSDVPPIPIPIKWYAMELALMRFVEENKRAVLLEKECFEMASTFHFDEVSFKAALRYLHAVKHIFYYEEEGLVIAEMQFILDELSQIVRYNVELRTNPSQHEKLDYKWIKFCHHGILHPSCLDEFPDRYVPGVFTSKELLLLFKHLSIVSEQSPDEYLMPCLLLEEDKGCQNPEPETQAVPALTIEFPDGSPMLGSYCALVCHLMNTEKWKLAENEDGDPCLLTRNSIRFLAPKDNPGTVTINDPRSSFFLVTFHGSLRAATKICPLIRESIFTAIDVVSKSRSYFPQDAAETVTGCQPSQPFTAFLCTCETSPLHSSRISDEGEFLTCPNHLLREVVVTDEHRIWFKGVSYKREVASDYYALFSSSLVCFLKTPTGQFNHCRLTVS